MGLHEDMQFSAQVMHSLSMQPGDKNLPAGSCKCLIPNGGSNMSHPTEESFKIKHLEPLMVGQMLLYLLHLLDLELPIGDATKISKISKFV